MEARKSEILRELEQRWTELRSLATRVGMDDTSVTIPNSHWTVKDALAHLSSGTVAYPQSVERWLSGQSRTLAELNAINEQRVKERLGYSLEQVRDELEHGYQTVRRLIETIDEGVLDRKVRTARGEEVTIEDRLRHVGEHFMEHATDIEAALATR